MYVFFGEAVSPYNVSPFAGFICTFLTLYLTKIRVDLWNSSTHVAAACPAKLFSLDWFTIGSEVSVIHNAS